MASLAPFDPRFCTTVLGIGDGASRDPVVPHTPAICRSCSEDYAMGVGGLCKKCSPRRHVGASDTKDENEDEDGSEDEGASAPKPQAMSHHAAPVAQHAACQVAVRAPVQAPQPTAGTSAHSGVPQAAANEGSTYEIAMIGQGYGGVAVLECWCGSVGVLVQTRWVLVKMC